MNTTRDQGYKVLARKYRPANFSDLIGQDTMVKILRNAFSSDRIAQAFILTGIRGTGKTTTARIIAKGINCIGPNGISGPTTDPCDECENCIAISEGRHVDIMEMDAASRTGVGDIREIIESVHYRAASAKYKIYIIDEVHMLSTSAFNALLKTLEEPPEHVKFIFATTEIQKVPVTVLSRCQRFDLRRIEPETMIAYLNKIALSEHTKISNEALALITRASEGSARDAISLLDQSISNSSEEISSDQIREMLGLSDRGRILDLFDLIMKGNAVGALKELSALYSDGADPTIILQDLAEVTHWISLIKITPEAINDPTVSPSERARGHSLAETLNMRSLSRMWQMLIKVLEEIRLAPNSMMAAEMAIIRLTHVADLPSPDELIKKMQGKTPPEGAKKSPQSNSNVSNESLGQPSLGTTQIINPSQGGQILAQKLPENSIHPNSFDQVINLIKENRDIQLLIDVETCLKLAHFSPGRIEFVPTIGAPRNLAQKLGNSLSQWTGSRWAVSVVNAGGDQTIFEKRTEEVDNLKKDAIQHPLVKATLLMFPNSKIVNIKTAKSLEAEAALQALPEVNEEWDPFEDD
jgi:DNA polymerase-3 subunit gamma/tau